MGRNFSAHLASRFEQNGTSQVSLAYGNLPSLYQAPRPGMDRGVFLEPDVAQTREAFSTRPDAFSEIQKQIQEQLIAHSEILKTEKTEDYFCRRHA